MNPQQYTGIIIKKLQLTKTVFHFVIQNEKPSTLDFEPGQYATFFVDEKTRRQYSFCSPPNPTSFELVVDTSPMGTGSQYFLKLKEGEKVEFLAPLGKFTLSENSLKTIFIATGAGIAPFRSMLLKVVHSSWFLDPKKKNNGLLSTNQEPGTMNLSLYWGLRFEDDVYWDSEFKALAGQYTGLQYFLSLSKPGENWHGLVGHVTDRVLEKEKNPQNCEFYLCGNSAMITEMKQRLSDIKVPQEQVKIDTFY